MLVKPCSSSKGEHDEKIRSEKIVPSFVPSPHRKIQKMKLIFQRKPMFPKTNGSKQVIVK